ncbi:MAG: ATP-grasp domain-containing protein [Candidatus Aminicenantales bacterium]
MARLYEYQGKRLLKEGGVRVPHGNVVFSAAEARGVAEKIGKAVVLKIQIWLTGRAGLGGIQFADTPQDAEEKASRMLGMKVGNYIVDRLLVEEKLAITAEYFAGLVMDDARKCPLLVFSAAGGTGVEEIARNYPEKIVRMPIDVATGLREFEARNLVRKTGLSGGVLTQLADLLAKFYGAARSNDARSAEINPVVLTEDGAVYAADCHLVIDDYAVFRHPELGIEVAREFDRPPTELEKIAYKVEEKDYRGTFYFFQMIDKIPAGDPYIGFHGAGGGGSMMSMDAVLDQGFKLANYCDTSGNPPASKVYRAAKIILSQPGIRGYFASGSGVASQEQYHSARGLIKAFLEEDLRIPAVIRLGGNCEEEAIRILADYGQSLPAGVEGYGRDDAPEKCATRLKEMILANGNIRHEVIPMEAFRPAGGAYSFETLTGRLFIDHKECPGCRSKGCVESCAQKILKLEGDHPVLAIPPEQARKGKCTECLACEIFCRFHERKAIAIDLPIPGLKEYREKKT